MWDPLCLNPYRYKCVTAIMLLFTPSSKHHSLFFASDKTT